MLTAKMSRSQTSKCIVLIKPTTPWLCQFFGSINCVTTLVDQHGNSTISQGVILQSGPSCQGHSLGQISDMDIRVLEKSHTNLNHKNENSEQTLNFLENREQIMLLLDNSIVDTQFSLPIMIRKIISQPMKVLKGVQIDKYRTLVSPVTVRFVTDIQSGGVGWPLLGKCGEFAVLNDTEKWRGSEP